MSDESGGNRLSQDDLIRQLVPDPSEVPDTKVFFGFLGASDRDGYCRLYLTTGLSDYLEIPEDDVLLRKPLQTAENPLGGTALWVRAEATVHVSRRASEDAEAKYLTGEISAKFLQGASASGISVAGSGTGRAPIKSIPPVESCVPALCLPPPPPPDPPGTAVCTLTTRCRTEFLCFP